MELYLHLEASSSFTVWNSNTTFSNPKYRVASWYLHEAKMEGGWNAHSLFARTWYANRECLCIGVHNMFRSKSYDIVKTHLYNRRHVRSCINHAHLSIILIHIPYNLWYIRISRQIKIMGYSYPRTIHAHAWVRIVQPSFIFIQ